MISIGIAQIPNSTEVSKNFSSIQELLEKFKKTDVDLVVFPECSLSGFSSKMRECTQGVLQPYLEEIQSWVDRTGIEVVLPTAIVENDKIFNSGFWFKNNEYQRFYKVGLTESEKKFFSLPLEPGLKVFRTKGYNLALLICFEIEHQPWAYFEKGEADAILWPGYWGWTLESRWEKNRDEGKPNPIFLNMNQWQLPILQANFAYNDLDGHQGAGPEGLSFIINHDNTLTYRGPHLKSDGFVVSLEKKQGKTLVSKCRGL
jgi:predicted amidohydrolase